MDLKNIECVPNFCEGRDQKVIDEIRNAIESQSGVEFKCVDTGYYAHRSVYTFLGDEQCIFQAAYKSIEKASQLIDMRNHHGAHPRFGAIDVFPFVALNSLPQSILIPQVEEFAAKVAQDFKIPIYLYEKSAKRTQTKNLADIRRGEYEGLEEKMKSSEWEPDFYPHFNPKSGGMAMGVRDLLVAFNVNLDTNEIRIAKKIAADIRYSGKIVNGDRVHGKCDGVKAIGWYIKDFDKVQVSMNIVDISKTPVHVAYESCQRLAETYGVRVTGSELIGCIPKQCLIEAGKYFLAKEDAKHRGGAADYLDLGVKSLNLNEVKPFDFARNTIELQGFKS